MTPALSDLLARLEGTEAYMRELELKPGVLSTLIAIVHVQAEALEQLQLGHEHNESNPGYRPLGDSYGWCSSCSTKVSLNEDVARDAQAQVERLVKGEKA